VQCTRIKNSGKGICKQELRNVSKWMVLDQNDSFIHVKNINNFIMYAQNYWKIIFRFPKCIFFKLNNYSILRCQICSDITICDEKIPKKWNELGLTWLLESQLTTNMYLRGTWICLCFCMTTIVPWSFQHMSIE